MAAILQCYSAGVSMVYIAMYDEVDEGTAMYKLAPNATQKPVNGKFISADLDGTALPTDWYLQIAGVISNVVRGKTKNTEVLPLKPKPGNY
ncbi:MAG: hypothetical protein WDN26_18975 [Chitinophagaceae bacterium]